MEIRTHKVIVLQPALPAYRVDFFERVSKRLGDRFSVRFASTDMGALTAASTDRAWAVPLPPMREICGAFEWQDGILETPLQRGDILVVCGAPRNLSMMLMLLKAASRGVRTVWWGHYWSGSSKKYRHAIRVIIMKAARAVLFYTDMEIDEYRAGLGKGDKRPVFALNNGINVEPIAARRVKYSAARGRDIMFIGRLTPKADLPVLFRALADPRLADVRLHLVGDGPQRDYLKELALRLGVNHLIEWCGETIDEDRIAGIANRSRLFAYPGAVGLSLVHAMAYGLPAVLHDDRPRHMPEIAAFYAAGCGPMFSRGSPESLADALYAALNSSTSLAEWSSAATDTVARAFNTRHMADRFCELIDLLEKY